MLWSSRKSLTRKRTTIYLATYKLYFITYLCIVCMSIRVICYSIIDLKIIICIENNKKIEN